MGFLGLLGGREVAMLIRGTSKKHLSRTIFMIVKDASKAIFGLLILSMWPHP